MKGAKEYESELQALRSFSKGDNFVEGQIKILEKTAKSGTSNIAALSNEFIVASEKILKKDRQEKPNKSLTDKVALGLSSVVHVRKVAADETSGKIEDILARAGIAIESGHIDTALTEIEKLPSDKKQMLDAWSQKAKEFVSIQAASEEVFQYVINSGYKDGSDTNG